jgi:hypothetical protein
VTLFVPDVGHELLPGIVKKAPEPFYLLHGLIVMTCRKEQGFTRWRRIGDRGEVSHHAQPAIRELADNRLLCKKDDQL